VKPILEWVKANVFIVVFGVLIIAAFVALPLISRGMNDSVQRQLSTRTKLDTDMTSLGSTSIELTEPDPRFKPLQPGVALINRSSLDEYRAYVESREAELNQLVTEFEQHNRRSRAILVADLLPDVRIDLRDRKIVEFSAALRAAYEKLLADVKAGTPPTVEQLRERLVRSERQFVSRQSKSSVSELTPEERATLQQELSASRLAQCEEAARNLALYASIDLINPPWWEAGGGQQPTMKELFYWQWDYWVIDDVIRAVGKANGNSNAVVGSPVKRIKSIRLLDSIASSSSSQDSGRRDSRNTGGDSGGGNFFLSGGGTGGNVGGNDPATPPAGGGGAGRTGATTPAGQPVDPTREVPRDFSVSLTGRTTNGLYDVRFVELHLVVETARLPQVFDSIASHGFMTIVGMDLWPADPFADLAYGYVYGSEPTTEVVLTLETIWLRSWTSQFMPAELKAELGIPVAPAVGNP